MTTPSRPISRKEMPSFCTFALLLGPSSLSLCESNIRLLEKSLINKRSSGQRAATTRRMVSARFTASRAVPSDH
ncbi:hypothetical protein HDF16_001908 [Granulicella aggregans]|uniref:Uncharacterized protein n=1 Tax=Granulicella aggregans TaxID=474949 RepID=A0A7W7ZCI0_9BACT|nr:hypothetical protein [Granulicella aggregans]